MDHSQKSNLSPKGKEGDSHSEGKSVAPPPFQLKASGGGENPMQRKSGGNLPSDLVDGFAATSGEDLGDVKVVKNSQKPAEVGALAYAQGDEIHLGAGQEKHLPHEAAHVVQQRKGMVNPTTEVAGKPVNDDKKLESQADEMGQNAIQRKAQAVGDGNGSKGNAKGAAQLKAAIIQRLSFADAKQQIEDATKGWGTNKSSIYAAIRAVSVADRALLKADATVQSILKKNLSGHDYFRALLLLEYGSEANYPSAVTEIFAATDGWGVDQKRIFRALEKLNAVDVAKIKALPGMADILKDELGKEDLGTANDLLDGKYAQAIQNHKDNVAFVKNEFQQMRTSGTQQEKNTAEWMEPQTVGATAKNDLFILTKTHDAVARGEKHGKKDDLAYFGDDKKYADDTSTYDAEISSKRGLRIEHKWTGGMHLGRKIWVMEPKTKGSTTFREVLIHEVQHDADRHDDEHGHDKSYKSPEEAWNRYKTEFRAYWMDGQRSWISAVSGSEPAPWDNKRQKAIYDHMMATGYSEWLDPSYQKNPKVYGTPFQDLIHGYARPEGVNLQNSPAIDNFYIGLKKCKPTDTDLTKAPLTDLTTLVGALTPTEKTDINAGDAKRLQETMKDHLDETAILPHFAKLLNGGVLPAWANVNISAERKAITDATKGWGTDTKKIFDTIENATVAERVEMKRDTQIRMVIFENLSGHDLYHALFSLEYGAMAQWPSALNEIYDATKGWGTDQQKIRTALEGMTKPQVLALAKVEGLKDLLDANVKGTDKEIVDSLLAGDYADALDKHAKDIKAIDGVIQAGLAGVDATWKSLCQKLIDPSQALVYGLTLTHDSAKRVTKFGETGKSAYFGLDKPYPQQNGSYDSNFATKKNIRFATAGTTSETVGKNVYIYSARLLGASSLKTILETFAKTLP